LWPLRPRVRQRLFFVMRRYRRKRQKRLPISLVAAPLGSSLCSMKGQLAAAGGPTCCGQAEMARSKGNASLDSEALLHLLQGKCVRIGIEKTAKKKTIAAPSSTTKNRRIRARRICQLWKRVRDDRVMISDEELRAPWPLRERGGKNLRCYRPRLPRLAKCERHCYGTD